MHLFRRLFVALFLTVISVVLIFSAIFAYMIVTPLGGKILVRYFKQQFVAVGLMHVGHFEGSLQEGFILKDIRIIGLSYLPNAVLRIQEVRVHLPLWDLPHYDFSIFNARILIPDSDPFVFTGEISAGQIKGDLYSKSVDIHEASRFWTNDDIRKNLKGYISDIDFTIQGPLDNPQIKGSFTGDGVRYKSIVVSDGKAKVDVTMQPALGQVQMEGQMILISGSVNVRNVNLDLHQSKITFEKDPLNPNIDIRLGSKVEDMDINLAIKGTLINPQLMVSSDPPMSPQEALQILFTGNAFGPATSPFNGVTSGQLAQNFLDYSLKDMNDDQNLGLKTKLTSSLKLGVEMDQLPVPPGDTSVYYSRKINGEMDMTDHMSLNVSQEVLPQERDPSQAAQEGQPSAETQIYVQYKKRF